jgi:hypothetical protein
VGDSGGSRALVGDHRVDPLPGAQAAVQRGCVCSVLANAAYRTGASDVPLVDPECPLHAALQYDEMRRESLRE